MLTSEYSFWWIPVITLFASGLSYVLYRKDAFLSEASRWVKVILISLRWLALFAIGIFLIKPLFNNTKTDFVKPQLIILQDESQSIKMTKDSLYYKSDFNKDFKSFLGLLDQEEIEYVCYGFSDTLAKSKAFSFNKKITNISASISEALDLNIDKNIGGLLLLSDGIYNKGRDPFYTTKHTQLPIYTVGLGDTTSFSDLKIEQININKIGFSLQNIPFSIDIKAEQLSNENSTLSISENGKTLFSQTFSIDKSVYLQTITKAISHLEVGFHALRFELSALPNESNVQNNIQTIYIQIVESKQRILLLYSAPHPDIAALKSAISSQVNFEFEAINIRDFKGQLGAYNLVILHQLPDLRNLAVKILENIEKNHISVLSIVTPQTDLVQLNKLKANLIFKRSLNKNNWIELEYNSQFTLFNVSDDLKSFINHVPPLLSPMMDLLPQGSSQVFAQQTIKHIKTEESALIFTENENQKWGFILGEGLWRWKIFNYQSEQNFNLFNEWMSKTVQYLSLKQPKEAFMVDIKNQFEEYESVEIKAQLYNQSLEPINNLEVDFSYFDEKNVEYKQILNPSGTGYYLNLGSMPAGQYRYEIATKMEGKGRVKKGYFVVVPSVLEFKNLSANHQLLKSISEQTNAVFFDKDRWFSVVDAIKQNPKFKTQAYNSQKLSDWIDLKWLMLLIVLLLSLEWFLRKYNGSI